MTSHAHVLAFVAATWPNPPWAPEGQALFLRAIRGFDAGQILAAAEHFYTGDAKGFRPTVGQLAALIAVPDPDAAGRGWSAFRLAVAHYAGKPTHETPDMPSFEDARVADAVRGLGGFRQFLGGLDANDTDFLRRRFVREYERVGAKPLALPGADVPELNGRGPGPAAIRGLLGGKA